MRFSALSSRTNSFMEGVIEKSPIIKPINKNVVHKICAGQVILDLASAVKELVENSLDAGATSIEVALKEYGLDSFQVVDNGSGILPENFKVLALKHHTSKLSGFPDLQSLTTFGFRGEVLSSLCAIGDLTVETRTVDEVVATQLKYDHTGLLTAERKTARQIGTTVTVKNLFSNLPVRSQEFRKNIRREYGKLINLLNAYALIAKGVKLVCTNTTGKNVKSVVLKTQGSRSLEENIIAVFGTSSFSCLQPLRLSILGGGVAEGFVSKSGYGSGRNIGDRQFFFVNGRPVDMPKVGKLLNELYRGANSKQYPVAVMNFSVPTQSYDVNVTPDKRKIFVSDETSILQSLREALEQIYSADQASYSVNRVDELYEGKPAYNMHSPNARSQMLSKQLPSNRGTGNEKIEDELCAKGHINVATTRDDTIDSSSKEKIQSGGAFSMIEQFALRVHGSKKKNFSLNQHEQVRDSASEKNNKHCPNHSRSFTEGGVDNANSFGRSSSVQMSIDKFVTANKRKREAAEIALSDVPVLQSGIFTGVIQNSSANCSAVARSPENCADVDNSNEADRSVLFPCGARNASGTRDDGVAIEETELQDQEPSERVPGHVLTDSFDTAQPLARGLADATISSQSSSALEETPVVFSGSKVGFTLHFSFRDLISRRKQRLSRLRFISHAHGVKLKGDYTAASLEVSQIDERKAEALVAATKELERLFKKEYFKQMKVIGQFNLGFIIAKLDNDLFIVDQHAADEKYNYEHLAQTTILNQQPLLRPLKMEFSPEEEIVISMHMNTFRKNGFLLEESMHAPPGHRFILKAVPFSKKIVFGVSDVRELISILSDSHGDCSMTGSYRSDTADSVCPSKTRSMLASRACRSSVMIGDSLGRNEMQKILEHLSGLKSPWNCPHGRPTMRHLVDLRSICRTDDQVMELL